MRNDMPHIKRTVLQKLTIAAIILMVSSMLIPYHAWAQDEEESAVSPLREVHKVKVNKKNYCFFVENNVVLTPEDIKNAKTDEALTATILKRAGPYMIETNCKNSDHNVITMQKWIKKGGSFLLSKEDLDKLRAANPAKGKPVKLNMDVLISDKKAVLKKAEPEKTEEAGAEKTNAADKNSTDNKESADDAATSSETADTDTANDSGAADSASEDDKDKKDEQAEAVKYKYSAPVYNTYKPLSESLLFVVIATKADAKSADYVCEDPNADDSEEEQPEAAAPAEPEEILPEYRTIYMEDRKGRPVEATLKDGEKVKLEWIEPGTLPDGEASSLTDRIPGGIKGAAVIAVLMIAAIAGIAAAAVRKKRS